MFDKHLLGRGSLQPRAASFVGSEVALSQGVWDSALKCLMAYLWDQTGSGSHACSTFNSLWLHPADLPHTSIMSRMPRRNAHPITQGCIWRRLSCCVCGYSAWHMPSSLGSTARKSREAGQWTSAFGASAPGHTCSPRLSGFTTCETWESAWVVILSLSSRSLLALQLAPPQSMKKFKEQTLELKGRGECSNCALDWFRVSHKSWPGLFG